MRTSGALFPFFLAMRKADKPKIVESLSKEVKEAKSLVVVDYQGLSVGDLNDLRNKIKEAGGRMLVVKNTLLTRALKKMENKQSLSSNKQSLSSNKQSLSSNGKWKMENVQEGLTGPTAVVFANDDEIAPLQVIGKSIKEMDLPKFKFGIFDSEVVDSTQLDKLSKLPGKTGLLGQLLSTIAAPAYSLVGTLQGNTQSLLHMLNEKSKGGE